MMMKKYLIILMMLISLSIAYADSMAITCPVFIGIGETRNISASIDGNYTDMVQVNFSDDPITFYNMTNTSLSEWYLLISNNATSDFTATFTAINSTDNITTDNCLIKSREPFYITLRFYSGMNRTDTHESKPYLNQFDYVYVYPADTSTGIKTPNYFSGILEIMTLLPVTKDYYSGKDNPMLYDRNAPYFIWSDYESGVALLKIYEIDTYQINILGSDTKSDQDFYEFDKPYPSDYRWQTQITAVNLSKIMDSPRNVSLSIYLQPWEANKSQFYLDMIKWIFLFVGLVAVIWIELAMGLNGLILIYSIVGYMIFASMLGWLI
jgi:hypothetical protein